VDVVLGDARLSLTQCPDAHYDLIVLDAFNSDSIPIHLLTREALSLYLSKLTADGILAFHISNKYLNLRPVVGNWPSMRISLVSFRKRRSQ
jgi:spermidine synthase